MQDQKISLSDEVFIPKPRKKSSTRTASVFQAQGDNVKRVQKQVHPYPTQAAQKPSKRGISNVVPASLQQPEKSPSDSLTDPATSGNEYRALRIKYLLLEEESFELGKELRETEDEIENLEQEKHELLDELVVLEGLVDPSEIQPRGLGSK